MQQKILIIEDETNIADIIEHNLHREGYKTIAAYDGEAGLQTALTEDADLVLLDVMLPKLDGWEVLRRLRESSITPVIMLTAREEEQDKIMGLDLGADDYMTKPFSMKELLSRIRANLRRIHYERPALSDQLTVGDLILDIQRGEVIREGKRIELSNKEFSLISFFATNPGKIFSREELLEKVWHYEGFYGDLRAVDVMIRRLREKLESDAGTPQYIQTKRGQGYFFEVIK